MALISSIALSEGVGVLSGFLSMGSMKQYQNLVQPPLSPPGWVFGPVWGVLFLLMGIAAYRVWMHKHPVKDIKNALTWYGVQLFLNFLWTILFFKFEMRGLALIDILLLLIAIIITTLKFYRIDKIAGYLMVPYILWVAFATYLNYSIWVLNK